MTNEERLEKGRRHAKRIKRAWREVASTESGKIAIESLRQAVSWDEASPAQITEEQPVFFWIGQRSVMKYIFDQLKESTGLDNS